jgi:hypothetical protein
MDAVSRRKYEMSVRVVEFITAHPDTEPGQSLLEGELKELRVRFEQAAAAQRTGLIEVQTGTETKRSKRRELLAGPIAHFADIGQLAARDGHEVRNTFRFKPSADTHAAFRNAAGAMHTAAVEHQELLLKQGASASVFELFAQLLEQYDAAAALSSHGRAAHTAATAELHVLGREIVQVVRAMDVRNRVRFKDDRQLLGAWINASTVFGSKRPAAGDSAEPGAGGDQGGPSGGTPAGGDVRPAV